MEGSKVLKIKLSNTWWTVAVVVVGASVATLVWFFVINPQNNSNQSINKNTYDNASSDSSSNSNSTKQSTKSADVLPVTTFTNGLGSWYEEVWYEAASSGGEVTTGSGGVTFTAKQSNSRSGIMIDLNKDVSKYKKVTINLKGVVNSQTLTGTGFNGREAPVAVAVAYQATDGSQHILLGENPTATTQMFWRGFYYLDPSSGSGKINGVKVSQNKQFSFSFDLMTLSPKPETIYYAALEGAGWKSRQGSVSSFNIVSE